MATCLWLSAQPLMGVKTPTPVQRACDRTSEALDEPLRPSVPVRVLDMQELPDGELRACVVPKGSTTPLGWITVSTDPDGSHNLQPAFNSQKAYEVVSSVPPLVRKRCDLTSEVVGKLPVGTIVHIVDLVRMADGAHRVRVVVFGLTTPIGWITARKPHLGICIIRELPSQESPSSPPLPAGRYTTILTTHH